MRLSLLKRLSPLLVLALAATFFLSSSAFARGVDMQPFIPQGGIDEDYPYSASFEVDFTDISPDTVVAGQQNVPLGFYTFSVPGFFGAVHHKNTFFHFTSSRSSYFITGARLLGLNGVTKSTGLIKEDGILFSNNDTFTASVNAGKTYLLVVDIKGNIGYNYPEIPFGLNLEGPASLDAVDLSTGKQVVDKLLCGGLNCSGPSFTILNN